MDDDDIEPVSFCWNGFTTVWIFGRLKSIFIRLKSIFIRLKSIFIRLESIFIRLISN